MKKVLFAILAICSFGIISCEKNIEPIAPQDNDSKLVKMTFSASTPTTKTAIGTLSEGQYPVTWSEGDKIRVIAVDADGARMENENEVFDIDPASVGSETASFTGTSVEGAAAYYAVYPATLTIESYEDEGYITLKGYADDDHKVKAVAGGFDTSKAAMVATANGSQLAFNHAVSYFKITVAQEGIQSIKFYFNSDEGNARIWGNPIVNVATGAASEKALELADKNKNFIILEPESGTLQKDMVYYIPFASKKKAIKTPLLISFTNGSYTVTKKTSKLQGVTLGNGEVYDLGTPPVSFAPSLTLLKSSVINIPYTAAEGLVIENAYKLSCCTDEDVIATCDGTIITDVSISNGTVTYSISENDGEQERAGSIYLKLKDQEEELEISVNQLANGSSVSVANYTWNFTTLITTSGTGFLTESSYSYTAPEDANAVLVYYPKADGKDKTASSSNKVYLQPNGAGNPSGTNLRYFTFTSPSAGTLTINGCSNKDATSNLIVKVGGAEVTATSGGSSTNATPSDHVYSIGRGEVVIYADATFRYYIIAYTNQ